MTVPFSITKFSTTTAGPDGHYTLTLPAGRSMKSRLPFGPFLAFGAMAYIFFGPELIYWYLGILR